MKTSNFMPIAFKGLYITGNNSQEKDRIAKTQINQITQSNMGDDLFSLDRDVAKENKSLQPGSFFGSILNSFNIDAIVGVEKKSTDPKTNLLGVALTRKNDTNILGFLTLEKIKTGLAYSAKGISNSKETKLDGTIDNTTQAFIDLIDTVSVKFLKQEGRYATENINQEWVSFQKLIVDTFSGLSKDLKEFPRAQNSINEREDKISKLLTKGSDVVLSLTSFIDATAAINAPDKNFSDATKTRLHAINSDWDDFTQELKTCLKESKGQLISSDAPNSVKNLFSLKINTILGSLTFMNAEIAKGSNLIRSNGIQ